MQAWDLGLDFNRPAPMEEEKSSAVKLSNVLVISMAHTELKAICPV